MGFVQVEIENGFPPFSSLETTFLVVWSAKRSSPGDETLKDSLQLLTARSHTTADHNMQWLQLSFLLPAVTSSSFVTPWQNILLIVL